MKFRRRQRGKCVAIFGGSFNPPHKGHTAICEWLFAERHVGEVWVIPCFVHPFNKELAPFEDRVMMCKLALGKLMLPIKVLDVERNLGGTSHTLRTVNKLKSENRDCHLFLVRGADVKEQEYDWKDFDEIKEIVEIIDIPRGKHSPIPDISSTDIRQLISEGKPFSDYVESEVAVHIATRGLYRPAQR